MSGTRENEWDYYGDRTMIPETCWVTGEIFLVEYALFECGKKYRIVCGKKYRIVSTME